MKGNLKVIVSLVLVFALGVLLFAGCGQSNKSSDNTQKSTTQINSNTTKTDSEDTTAQDKYAPIEGKKYKITWAGLAAATVNQDGYMIKKLEDLFNVDIDFVNIDISQWDDLLNLKFSSGDIPDVFYVRSVDRLSSYHDQKLLFEIPEEAITKYAPDLDKRYKADVPNVYDYTKINGKIYAIPALWSPYSIRQPLVWRTDWLNNVGITKIPETLQEFEDAFIKFVNNDPDKNGKKDTYALSTSGFAPIFGAYGTMCFPFDTNPDRNTRAFWKEKDGKLVYGGILPEAKEALATLTKWFKMGLIHPEFAKGENKGSYWAVSTDFINGKIGYTAHANSYHWTDEDGWNVNSNLVEMAKIFPDKKFKVDFGMPPIGPNGDRGMSQFHIVYGEDYGISTNIEKEPDKLGKIFQIMNWFFQTPENGVEGMFGKEGVHFDWTDENGFKVPKFKAEYLDPAKYDAEALTTIFLSVDSVLGKLIYSKAFDFNQKHGMMQYGVEDALFVPLPSMGKYKNELEKMMDEAYMGILTGKKPIDYFDEFIKDWENAGGNKLTEEANNWYKSIK